MTKLHLYVGLIDIFNIRQDHGHQQDQRGQQDQQDPKETTVNTEVFWNVTRLYFDTERWLTASPRSPVFPEGPTAPGAPGAPGGPGGPATPLSPRSPYRRKFESTQFQGKVCFLVYRQNDPERQATAKIPVQNRVLPWGQKLRHGQGHHRDQLIPAKKQWIGSKTVTAWLQAKEVILQRHNVTAEDHSKRIYCWRRPHTSRPGSPGAPESPGGPAGPGGPRSPTGPPGPCFPGSPWTIK